MRGGRVPGVVLASVGALAVLALIASFAFLGLAASVPPAPGCCPSGPPARHSFGTWSDGRELLWVVAEGLGTSAAVSGAGTLLALLLGTAWGSFAASRGRRMERALMRLVDLFSAAPWLLFVIIFVVIARAVMPFMPATVTRWWDDRLLVVVVVAGVEWLTLARVVHARLAALRRRPFMEAAAVMGMARWHILRVHTLPHVMRPLSAYAVLALPGAFATEGLLSFVGFGVMAPHSSLGTLLAEGARAMSVTPLALLVPAAALVTVTVALHIVGGWLRDRLGIEPR